MSRETPSAGVEACSNLSVHPSRFQRHPSRCHSLSQPLACHKPMTRRSNARRWHVVVVVVIVIP